ncbi:hypothetical protein V6M85_05750 [Sulfolobus tengchongensis]|uniref:Uncharacterized protein n=1 Tax=Sulfolobus tengchongensis TaxID=207809 RepID=A0AAX4L407_9CREN
MDLLEKARKLRSLGDEYENLLNDLLNELFKLIPDCLALNIDDSLLPVYAISGLKTKGILAFPYKCRGRVGYVIIGEDGILYFEDTDGNVIELK